MNYYNLKYTPQIKFGHLLFKDWDYEQWNMFYNWVANFLQIFLSEGLVYTSNSKLLHKRLHFSAGEQFIHFIDERVKLDVKINKLELYSEFHEEYRLYNKITSQRTFTNCLRLYADAHNYGMQETKSGSNYFFMFYSKEVKK